MATAAKALSLAHKPQGNSGNGTTLSTLAALLWRNPMTDVLSASSCAPRLRLVDALQHVRQDATSNEPGAVLPDQPPDCPTYDLIGLVGSLKLVGRPQNDGRSSGIQPARRTLLSPLLESPQMIRTFVVAAALTFAGYAVAVTFAGHAVAQTRSVVAPRLPPHHPMRHRASCCRASHPRRLPPHHPLRHRPPPHHPLRRH